MLEDEINTADPPEETAPGMDAVPSEEEPGHFEDVPPEDSAWVNGEVDYSSGHTRHIYSDAHYVPEGEDTVPPRYYTPPRKETKETKPPKPGKPAKEPSKKHLTTAGLIALCLCCALLGGTVGAGLVGAGLYQRLTLLESSLAEEQENTQPPAESVSVTPAPAAEARSSAPEQSSDLAEKYACACDQVVAITSEVTYYNFFGYSTSSASSGTGFILTEDGYILTNYHVIEDAYQGGYDIRIMRHDGSTINADVTGVEEDNDLAVLKIQTTEKLQPVTPGDSDAISVGDEIYAVGNPLGELEFSMTFGRVSALNRVISTDSSDGINMFQIDAAVNQGNSGGPVYDSDGKVIGVVTAKYSSTGVEGLGFAIPINDAMRIAEDLITRGYVTGKADLGVQIDSRYNALYSRYYNLPLGAFISSVDRSSCAYQAGIRAGDIITMVDEQSVDDSNTIEKILKSYSAGDTAQLTVYRNGETWTTAVTFDEQVPAGRSKDTTV